MRTATRKTNLQVLEEELKQRLQAAGFKNLPLQISCALMEETLLVVGEHQANVTLKTEATLASLQDAILEIQPKLIEQVGLCLRIAGQKQPYAFHSFTMQQSAPSRGSASVLPVVDYDEFSEDQEEAPLEGTEAQFSEMKAEKEPEISEGSLPSELFQLPASKIEEMTQNPFDPHDLETVSEAGESEVIEADRPSRSSVSFLTLIWVASAGVATAILLSGFYVVTRPCVLGECTAIPAAKQLSQESAKTLKLAKSSQSPVEAQQQLKQAIAQLEAIPFWSTHYWKAQNLLETYREQSQDLEVVLVAGRKAAAAAEKSQNPPHAAAWWQSVKSMWQEAIAPLEKLPKSSNVYPLAQKKLKEYRANLQIVERRLITEQGAEKKLNEAKKAAELAEAREGVAQFPESWQKVEDSWQTTVSTLSAIPQGTTGYEQAKLLLPKYETKLAEARDRKTQEETAVESYTDAVTSAGQARIFERRNGWFQSVEYWRRAVSSAEQVPATSSYYQKAQPLLSPYKISLQKAEAKLREERKWQTARQDLNKTCNGTLKVCDYTVSEELIAVQMTPAYVQQLRQTVKAAGTQDVKIRQGVEKHLETLRVALEAISDNAGIKLQVYDGEGKRIGVHTPKVSR